MKKLHMSLALVVLSSAPALAESWIVVEGPKGETQGAWEVTQRGGEISGKGVSQSRGAMGASYQVTGAISGGKVTARRVASTDGRTCNYIGEEKSQTEIVGTAICAGASGVWRVTRKQ